MNQQDIPALDPETPLILEMCHISKTFGAVTALESLADVDPLWVSPS